MDRNRHGSAVPGVTYEEEVGCAAAAAGKRARQRWPPQPVDPAGRPLCPRLYPRCSLRLPPLVLLTLEVLNVLRVGVRLVGLSLGGVVVELLVVKEVLRLLVVVVAKVLEIANRRQTVDTAGDVLLERDLGCSVSSRVPYELRVNLQSPFLSSLARTAETICSSSPSGVFFSSPVTEWCRRP